MRQKYQCLPSMAEIAVHKECAAAVVPSINNNSSPLHNMPGDADDFLARLTSAPSPVQSEFSDYGSMPRSPASVSGELLTVMF